MPGPRRSTGPVRQLSLQQPASRRQQIRRQRSAEDDKSLQVYANPIARGKNGTNARSGTERPKVRVAWSESRRSDESVEQVEVVARQIPGRSRPTTGRSSRKFIGLNEKATILYSRQELAERLRLAWKHREENKANIDIFLAHGTVEERCDSELSSHTTITAPPTPLPREETSSSKNIHLAVENDKESANQSRSSMTINAESSKESSEDVGIEDFIEKTRLVELDVEEHEEYQPERDEDVEDVEDVNETEIAFNDVSATKIKHSDGVKKVDPENETEEKWKATEEKWKATEEKWKATENAENPIAEDERNDNRKTCINISCTSLQQSESTITTLPSIKTGSAAATFMKTSKDDLSSARQKRASFQSCSNKAFLCPVVDRNAPLRAFAEIRGGSTTDKIVPAKIATEIKSNPIIDRSGRPPRSGGTEPQRFSRATTRRTNSAPPQRRPETASSGSRVQVNIVIDTPSILSSSDKQTADNTRGKPETIEAKEIEKEKAQAAPLKVSLGRPIRSAPMKRRSKSAKRRSLASGTLCKDDEDERSRTRPNVRGKGALDSRTIDVVTMVSLVSSTDSESDNENFPGDDKLINELRNKLPTTPIIKTSNNPSLGATKKTFKSVSFHKDSFDEDFCAKESQEEPKDEKPISHLRFTVVSNRGSGSNVAPGEETFDESSMPILSFIHDDQETLDIPLTDREKRCLAVPIGDVHEKKRRIIRTRDTVPPRSVTTEKQALTVEAKEHRLQPIVNTRNEISTSQPPMPTECSRVKIDRAQTLPPTKETEQETTTAPIEPHFQTSKEKECWHLYRRMCDKGVYVSFDTVLRGMLTPTEYRLRQKELTQDL